MEGRREGGWNGWKARKSVSGEGGRKKGCIEYIKGKFEGKKIGRKEGKKGTKAEKEIQVKEAWVNKK